MIRNLIITLLIFSGVNCIAQSNQKVGPNYDAELARKLGADEYGMKHYVIAFLKTGPNKLKDSAARSELQKAHLNNIIRLAAEGKLIVAGPFLDNKEITGIFIFDVPTVEEASKLAETDPAVKAGTLILELHPWYGSAALVETLKIHQTIQQKSVAD